MTTPAGEPGRRQVQPAAEDPVRAALDDAVARRLEAEEDERLAALDALRSQDLAAVARSLLARGEAVQVGLGDRRVTGRLAAVGADWIALDTVGGEVDVALGACAWLRALPADARPAAPRGPHSTQGHASHPPDAWTFRARLAQLELAGAALDLGTASADLELTGRLLAAARDHVVVREPTGAVWFVARVAWVRLRGALDS